MTSGGTSLHLSVTTLTLSLILTLRLTLTLPYSSLSRSGLKLISLLMWFTLLDGDTQ